MQSGGVCFTWFDCNKSPFYMDSYTSLGGPVYQQLQILQLQMQERLEQVLILEPQLRSLCFVLLALQTLLYSQRAFLYQVYQLHLFQGVEGERGCSSNTPTHLMLQKPEINNSLMGTRLGHSWKCAICNNNNSINTFVYLPSFLNGNSD